LHRSKLEICEDILKTLVRKPLKVDAIAYKISMDCVMVKWHLEFLKRNGLVEERLTEGENFYAITERGKSVFRVLSFQRKLEEQGKFIEVTGGPLETPALENKEPKEDEN